MKGFRERILGAAGKNSSRVVLALDFSGPYDTRLSRASKVLASVGRRVAAVKVNHHLLLPYGLEGMSGIIRDAKNLGLPLIADLKINDIESTNLNIVESLLSYGFDGVIANPFVGREEGLGKAVQRIHEGGGGILFLVYMSNKGAEEGYALKVAGEPVFKMFAKRARDWGADGVVVSAKDPGKIAETRKIVGKDCLIFSPGVGAQGGDLRTWEGTGADFVIVGRTLTEASDPLKALEKLSAG